jgi:hypothetical protein
MEILIVDLAREAVEYVDDRYGRLAAWIAALLGIATLIAVPAAFISYLFW